MITKVTRRKEVPVRNNPGIYKEHKLDVNTGKWKETGKYRATRRISENGRSKKEQAVFDNLEDAKAFRHGKSATQSSGTQVHKNAPQDDPGGHYTFGALVDDWKPFHYLKLERSTQQTYDKLLPYLDFLKPSEVKAISTSVIDSLVQYWVNEYPKSSRRETFGSELDLLKTILNYYRSRKNPTFVSPILEDHYTAADIAKKAKGPVGYLNQDELGRFLEHLKRAHNPQYYYLALTQFCLGLRIGEACGLTWEALDLKSKIGQIKLTIDWDQYSWKPRIKDRPKNGRVRFLCLPDILVKELEGLKRQSDPNVQFVFHKKGSPLNRKTIACAYNRALKRLFIKGMG